MRSKTEIDIEFKRAMEQAEELEELSVLLCNICNVKFDGTLSLLSKSWQGQNAVDYVKKTGKLKNNIYNSAEILKDTADMIRRTASLIYSAEMAAVSLCGVRW
ncbi:MAG: hypothetical protein K6E98_12745 [Lachnospiraceae bacterium]|nr:hypothetical protein [Lachnospiraceae bacterium]